RCSCSRTWGLRIDFDKLSPRGESGCGWEQPFALSLSKGSERGRGPSNSVARGLPVRAAVRGFKERAGVGHILGDALREGIEAVVLELVVQFVQQFHAHDFTVGLSSGQVGREARGPVQAMGF